MLAARRALAQPSLLALPPVPGYFASYDPQHALGVLNSSGTECADGQQVHLWKDFSGNAYDLTGGGNFYITTLANLINGHPAILFAAATGGATNGFLPVTAQPLTVFCVARTTNAATGGYLWANDSTSSWCRFLIGSGFYQAYAGTTSLNSNTADTNAHTMAAVMNGAGSLVRVDGSQIAAGNAGANGLNNGLILGQGPPGAGNAGFVGSLGEFIFYNSALTLAQIQATEAYLKAKWGTP